MNLHIVNIFRILRESGRRNYIRLRVKKLFAAHYISHIMLMDKIYQQGGQMKKVAIIVFNGEACCFAHVALYAFEMQAKGMEFKIIIEGAATKLVKTLKNGDVPFAKPYVELRDAGLIDCVCEACARQNGAYDDAVEQGLTLNGELKGHPSLTALTEAGYDIISL